MVKEIKCSRQKHKRFVPDDWKYKECPECHARTVKRFAIIRQYKPREFQVEDILRPMPSFEESLGVISQGKRLSKEAKEKERKIYEQMRADHEREKAKDIADAIKFYAHDKYPLRSNECRKIRDLAVKAEKEGFTMPLEAIFHGTNCNSCQSFFIALRRGEFFEESGLDPKETALQKKDEEQFAKGIRGNQEEYFPEDYYHGHRMTDVCSNCGTPLINGKCPNGC